MEQNIQPQQPISSFHNKNKIMVVIIITVAIITVSIYFWTTKNFSKNNNEQQNTQTQNQLSSSTGNDTVSTEINPKDYSLIASSVSGLSFKNFSGNLLECKDAGFLQDRRLVKGNKIIIPSLIDFIHNHEERTQKRENWDCDMVVSEFLIPENGKFLYLHVRYLTFNESQADNFFIYRIDLSDLSIKRLFSDIYSLYGSNLKGENHKLLQDEKRVVGWDLDTIYLADLEKDTLSLLYAATQNQWLVSREEETEVMTVYDYNIKVDENLVTVEVYDKNESIKSRIDNTYSVENYKLTNRVTIPIPPNQN